MAGNFLFQRYTQQENRATHNVVLLFQLFYRQSPAKFEALLKAICNSDEIVVGPSFEQQTRLANGVPDAAIQQLPFALHIETKLGDRFDQDQMKRHFQGLQRQAPDARARILLGLSIGRLDDAQVAEIDNLAVDAECRFVPATFEQLVDEAEALVEAHESFLFSAVHDFRAYLEHDALVDWSSRKLPIFPCGDSIEANSKYGVYYHPAERKSVETYKYIGLYQNKSVRFIGKIKRVVVSDLEKAPQLIRHGDIEAEHLAMEQIRQIAKTMDGYHGLKGSLHRYYVFESPISPANIAKVSKGGIQGMRYLDVPTLVQDRGRVFESNRDYSAEELAALLDGAEFE